jgi:PIN domain nuclease of toxin-antitoxin system
VSKTVLDASAILAVIMGESGQEKLTPRLLADAIISTVNLAEVQGKLQSLGWTSDEAWEDATGLLREAIHFDEHRARTAGDLLTQTGALGLSLEDRSCLVLGMALRAPVYTVEKAWKKIKVGIPIHVIR